MFGKDGGSHRWFVSVALIHTTSIVQFLHQHSAVSCSFMIHAYGLIYLCVKWLGLLASCH